MGEGGNGGEVTVIWLSLRESAPPALAPASTLPNPPQPSPRTVVDSERVVLAFLEGRLKRDRGAVGATGEALA